MKKATVMEVLLAENGDVINWQQSNNCQVQAGIDYFLEQGHTVYQLVTPSGCTLKVYPEGDLDYCLEINVLELYKAINSAEREL